MVVDRFDVRYQSAYRFDEPPSLGAPVEEQPQERPTLLRHTRDFLDAPITLINPWEQ